MKDREQRGPFRSDLDPTTPTGMTNYEGWPIKLEPGSNLDGQHIERQAKISLSMDSYFTRRMIMHGFILALALSTVLFRACER